MPDPMWRRIAEDLRQKIDSGELGRDGRPLPSELELRDTYDASRNTVRDAVKWLVTRGLVQTRPGQGTFVVQKIDPLVSRLHTELKEIAGREGAAFLSDAAARHRPSVSVPRVEIQVAKGLVASELHLNGGAEVVSRHQERFIDDTPWSLQTTFYPLRLVEMGAGRLIRAEDIPTGALDYIENVIKVRQAGRRDRITVRPPDSSESSFFGLPDDGRIAVFEVIQTGYDDSGTPFRVTVTTYPADRNQFVMTAGEVPTEELLAPAPEEARGDG
jgi:GntR family transcriptional regulator